MTFQPLYKTNFGKCYIGDSRVLLKSIESKSIDLVITSPPFALRRKKSYGNVSAESYVDWFLPFAEQISRILKPRGSFVLDIGGTWEKGKPIKSLYQYELLIKLCGKYGLFNLAQDFYWYNPAKIPNPTEWVNKRRIRVKDSVHQIWWMSKSSYPYANNRRVLTPYKKDMKNLFKKGYNAGMRPSEHNISNKWNNDNKGAIPPNLIQASNTRSTDSYIRACKKYNIRLNPARFVEEIPKFFIKFLTKPDKIILDPFSGSNVTGAIAEQLKRQWISIELEKEYAIGSSFRFDGIGEKLIKKLTNLH